jgi:hypothetical protein
MAIHVAAGRGNPERSAAMRRMIGLPMLSAVLVAAGSCESDSTLVWDAAERDSAGVRIIENVDPAWDTPWRVADEPAVTIGSAEGDSTQLLYWATSPRRLGNGSIVIANAGTNELLFFDSTGAFSHKAGGQGEGPGEFSMLVWISRFRADSLVAMDLRARRLSYLDEAGQFSRSVRLEPNPGVSAPVVVGIFHDGSLLVRQGLLDAGAEGPTRVERPNEVLYRYEPNGQSATALSSFPGREVTISPSTLGGGGYDKNARDFGCATAVTGGAQRYYVADNATYEIRAYDPDGGLSLLIRKQYVPVPVTDEDVRLLRDARLERISDPELQRAIRRGYTREPPPRKTRPAFGAAIRLDTEGNLWVPEYSDPGEQARAWSVFSESGEFLGVVDMPDGFTPHDIGFDYLLGLRTDQDDVEYVQLYELVKP